MADRKRSVLYRRLRVSYSLMKRRLWRRVSRVTRIRHLFAWLWWKSATPFAGRRLSKSAGVLSLPTFLIVSLFTACAFTIASLTTPNSGELTALGTAIGTVIGTALAILYTLSILPAQRVLDRYPETVKDYYTSYVGGPMWLMAVGLAASFATAFEDVVVWLGNPSTLAIQFGSLGMVIAILRLFFRQTLSLLDTKPIIENLTSSGKALIRRHRWKANAIIRMLLWKGPYENMELAIEDIPYNPFSHKDELGREFYTDPLEPVAAEITRLARPSSEPGAAVTYRLAVKALADLTIDYISSAHASALYITLPSAPFWKPGQVMEELFGFMGEIEQKVPPEERPALVKLILSQVAHTIRYLSPPFAEHREQLAEHREQLGLTAIGFVEDVVRRNINSEDPETFAAIVNGLEQLRDKIRVAGESFTIRFSCLVADVGEKASQERDWRSIEKTTRILCVTAFATASWQDPAVWNPAHHTLKQLKRIILASLSVRNTLNIWPNPYYEKYTGSHLSSQMGLRLKIEQTKTVSGQNTVAAKIYSTARHLENVFDELDPEKARIAVWPLACSCVKISCLLSDHSDMSRDIGSFLFVLKKIILNSDLSAFPKEEAVPFCFVQVCLYAAKAGHNAIGSEAVKALAEATAQWIRSGNHTNVLGSVYAARWCVNSVAEALGENWDRDTWWPPKIDQSVWVGVESRGKEMIVRVRQRLEAISKSLPPEDYNFLGYYDMDMKVVDPTPMLSHILPQADTQHN